MMDLTPLLCIVKAMKRPPFFLIQRLLLAIPVIFAIFVISPVSCVDFLIVLFLLRGSIAAGLKKSSPGLRSLNAYVSNCKQIGHRSGLLHGDLLHNLGVTDSVTESIDDLDILDVWDVIPSVAEMFHVVPEALIVLLLDGLQSLSNSWTLVCTLEVPDEYGTQLVPGVDRSLGQIDKS
jgi:hypothetical protein